MRILGVIPARGGSKGVPGKNIKTLGDNPLLYFTSNAANQSKLLDKTILSSDDSEIIKVAKENQINVPFIRPEHLANDTATSISVVQHAIEYMESLGEYYDAICLLQPTSPFREKGFIDAAIQKFITEDADALVSVLPVPHEFNPHWVFEPNDSGFLKISTGENSIISRRQDLPKSYFRDGSVYITKTEIIKRGSFYGEKLSFLESNPDFYVNIDTLKDWEIAENKLHFLKDRL
ncbi:acylneuraminate cytidylyltransferase family protein [Flavobacterium urocaniciphilum]|uniref:N-acylneuraminate cytidylyltransferase n=1 Tax=Flavobacterium urocaniciphilum TaxID=1299341 RepID=A0A1H8YRR1_9FLAO|nr:acylneuraminate cytidylyltransferase family protein [Flavobacterium urocaniciphilum]SEP54905.1 N-acylneuraminate cytidylyltransferase [Flavobacterium urocaniciphilum]